MINVALYRARCHIGYHYELTAHPPKDIDYHLVDVDKKIPTEVIFNGLNDWKRCIQFSRFLRIYDYIPYFSNSKQLIHAHGYPIVNRIIHIIDMDMFFYPYLIDADKFNQIKSLGTGWPLNNKLSSKSKKRLETTKKLLKSSFCRKILPWSKWCMDYIMDFIDDPQIVKKIELLYPAVHNINYKRQGHENIRLLYIGNIFIKKGGMDVLRAFEILRQDYRNIELIFIGEIPKEIYYKYRKFKNIKFYARLERQKLFTLYKKSDIFVLPTKNDTFGISLLEAMNFGLPIITTKGKFVPVSREIVDDGISGFLIELDNSSDSNRIEGTLDFGDFIAKLRLLIEDKGLREKMGMAGKSKIVDGKFSLKKRNNRLKEIYEEALQ